MNRLILRIALPSIVSNIIVPLLGLIDLAIAGHLGATAFIGAVSVGATMFNLTYWNFGFLRMGTSGMTAQAYGAGNFQEAYRILVRAIVLALTIGIAIILLQYPLKWILLYAISPGEEVHALATSYFDICIWGAPALLGTLAMSGWFLGMQNSFYPMAVSISVNIANIIASLLCVYSFGMGFSGIAAGTLIAQWTGFAISFVLLHRMIRKKRIPTSIDKRWMFHNMGNFFRVNGDIFIRSVCLMLVTLFFTAAGARSGDLILAVNALIMQLFMLYSYFMDGFAFAGEALAGRFAGERNVVDLKKVHNQAVLMGKCRNGHIRDNVRNGRERHNGIAYGRLGRTERSRGLPLVGSSDTGCRNGCLHLGRNIHRSNGYKTNARDAIVCHNHIFPHLLRSGASIATNGCKLPAMDGFHSLSRIKRSYTDTALA